MAVKNKCKNAKKTKADAQTKAQTKAQACKAQAKAQADAQAQAEAMSKAKVDKLVTPVIKQNPQTGKIQEISPATPPVPPAKSINVKRGLV